MLQRSPFWNNLPLMNRRALPTKLPVPTGDPWIPSPEDAFHDRIVRQICGDTLRTPGVRCQQIRTGTHSDGGGVAALAESASREAAAMAGFPPQGPGTCSAAN